MKRRGENKDNEIKSSGLNSRHNVIYSLKQKLKQTSAKSRFFVDIKKLSY
jgi:hypothetical protein